ncbi:jg17709 [Pararge aegeria aegeria]|uniref:Jg17709 protein n=1 Tax=Pararge aegeria aegeria TaxID=348720 RepID=A0A8S4QLG6_9NEOP|nr:jg17709 [Pararge aegeria aegeria]
MWPVRVKLVVQYVYKRYLETVGYVRVLSPKEDNGVVHADASLTQVGERQMSNAAERGGRLCPFAARFALSLALRALKGTPQSEVTPHESCFFVRAAGAIEL